MKVDQFLLVGICLLLVEIIASQTFTKNVIKTINVDAQKDCSQQNSCNMTTCTQLGICGQTCLSGRIKYPTLRKLTIPDVPTVQVNSEAVTLEFNIKGNCDNCTFLTMNGDNSYIRFSIQGTQLMIDNKINISMISSKSLIFRFFSGKGYIEKKEATFSIKNISSVSLVSDLNDNISLDEVGVYDDVLTSREIPKNESDPFCRCPPTHPEYKNGGCFMINPPSTGNNLLSSTSFYRISEALLDNKTRSKWASTDTEEIAVTIELYDVYQIEEIKMNIEETTPVTVMWEIFNGGKLTNMVDSGLFDNRITNNAISCTIKNGKESDISASGNIIRVTLNGTAQLNDLDQYIISGVELRAKCACRGIAMGCSANMNTYYQTYTCLNCSFEQQRNTPPCSSCQEDFYLNNGRCEKCKCNKKGTLKCERDGQCMCKIGVTGQYCDECIEGNSVCSTQPCNCTLPNITFSPSYGPRSGGTLVTLIGRNITVTPDVSVASNRQIIILRNSTQIIFRTSSGVIGKSDIVLSWRESTWPTSPYQIELKSFDLRPDPVLLKNTSTIRLAATVGCKLRFPGQNLDSVSQPKLTFTNLNKTTKCEVLETNEITCSMINLGDPKTTEALLEMDCSNCSERYNVTFIRPNIPPPQLDVDYTDPFVKEITIHGSNFDACDMNEVSITIGKQTCTITQLSDSSITCEPPTSAPDDKAVYKIQLKFGEDELIAGTITYKKFVESIYFIYIMVGLTAFVLLLLIILITVCLWKKRSKDTRNSTLETPLHERAFANNYTFPVENPIMMEPRAESFDDIKRTFLSRLDYSMKSDVENCLLPIGSFTTKTPAICIASGDKARMIEGHLTKDNSQIYIKYLKRDLPVGGILPNYVTNVLKECTRFRKLDDTNILRITGIAVEKNKFHIIYPYMEKRTLKAHVKDENQEFSLKQLTIYGRFVVDGMIYLSENGIYHRDLAARNCMVDDIGTVKISDGSFSFDFYPTEYMLDKAKHRYLPIRWMAPESISSGFYDSKSDVWAFGVLLWETLTRGCLPFVDKQESEIEQTIKEGYRLGKPEFVTDDMYVLMNTCWEDESDFRPTFERLKEQLDDIIGDNLNTSDDYVNINRSRPSDSIYMNSTSFKRRFLTGNE